jgi:hypothetical protein
MSQEKLMTNDAFVIEKTLNGIIVRPHLGWWRGDRESAFGPDQVRVFNDLKDFERWFALWFPADSTS